MPDGLVQVIKGSAAQGAEPRESPGGCRPEYPPAAAGRVGVIDRDIARMPGRSPHAGSRGGRS